LGLIRLLILAFAGMISVVLVLSEGQPYGAPLDRIDYWTYGVQYLTLAIVYGLTFSPIWPKIHHPIGSMAVLILALGSLMPYRTASESFYQTQFIATSAIAIFGIFALVRLPWTWASACALVVVAYSAYFVESIRPLPDGAMPWVSWAFAVLMGIVVCRKGEQTDQKLFEARMAVDRLLDSVYPKPVADRLRAGESVVADQIADAAVMMLDLVGFSKYSSDRPAPEVVRDLNDLYSLMDRLAIECHVTKIKTSGDLYMAIATGPKAADNLACFSLRVLEQAGEKWRFRIGLHLGHVAAGVVGDTRSLYDVWGNAVNLAARMEQTGSEGRIQVSAEFAERLDPSFVLEDRGEVEVKNLGRVRAAWLVSGPAVLPSPAS